MMSAFTADSRPILSRCTALARAARETTAALTTGPGYGPGDLAAGVRQPGRWRPTGGRPGNNQRKRQRRARAWRCKKWPVLVMKWSRNDEIRGVVFDPSAPMARRGDRGGGESRLA